MADECFVDVQYDVRLLKNYHQPNGKMVSMEQGVRVVYYYYYHYYYCYYYYYCYDYKMTQWRMNVS